MTFQSLMLSFPRFTRQALQASFGLFFLLGCASVSAQEKPAAISASVERLHEDIWKRFIYPPGLLFDYNGLDGKVDLPKPADFERGMPNALAWWCPQENGPFFTGLYLDGIIRRWEMTRAESDRVKARQLVEGLIRCASVSNVPGFIARGVGEDGKSHYSLGSDDQTGPWFYGLWRYVRSEISSAEEKASVTAKMLEVAKALEATRWLLPTDAVGNMTPGQSRGNLADMEYRCASRLLFISHAMHTLTQDAHWLELNRKQLSEKSKAGHTRLHYVKEGMPGEVAEFPNRGKSQLWIFVVSQACVRELIDLETDPEIKAAYQHSLRVTAESAVEKIVDISLEGLGTTIPYSIDWRRLEERWSDQKTVAEAVEVALYQIKIWNNKGRELETVALREPFCAAWLVLLNPELNDAAEKGIQRFLSQMEKGPWTSMHSSSGFFGEAAWYLAQSRHSSQPKK